MVLIIEDNKVIRNQIEKAILGNVDKEVKILNSKNAREALMIIENIDVDVFIIDIVLPDWDGIELAIEIRKVYPYKPIIIESSKNDVEYQSIVHDQISNLAFLTKPFTDEKLIIKLNEALGIAEFLGINHLKIKQRGFYRQVDLNDVLFIEKVKGKSVIEIMLYNHGRKCPNREKFISISLSAILNMLKDKKSLVRCHKGFIINPKMIEKLNYANNTISLKYTDLEIPIGRTYKNIIDVLL